MKSQTIRKVVMQFTVYLIFYQMLQIIKKHLINQSINQMLQIIKQPYLPIIISKLSRFLFYNLYFSLETIAIFFCLNLFKKSSNFAKNSFLEFMNSTYI